MMKVSRTRLGWLTEWSRAAFFILQCLVEFYRQCWQIPSGTLPLAFPSNADVMENYLISDIYKLSLKSNRLLSEIFSLLMTMCLMLQKNKICNRIWTNFHPLARTLTLPLAQKDEIDVLAYPRKFIPRTRTKQWGSGNCEP